MRKLVKMMSFVFGLLAITCMTAKGESSETACSAKCGGTKEIDKEALQDAYEEVESKFFDKKDEWMDDLKDYLLDEDGYPSEDYQTHFEEMREKWDEDIESVDFDKVKQDSRTILQEAEEWVRSLDLTSLRKDGEKQVDYYRKYVEDYRSIKDDFIDGNIGDFLNEFLELGNFKNFINLRSKGDDNNNGETNLKTDGFIQTTKSRKNKARIKALVNECKTRFNEIKDERQADYEELKEKYKDVHDDLKSKKRHWKELKKSWRRKKDADDDDAFEE